MGMKKNKVHFTFGGEIHRIELFYHCLPFVLLGIFHDNIDMKWISAVQLNFILFIPNLLFKWNKLDAGDVKQGKLLCQLAETRFFCSEFTERCHKLVFYVKSVIYYRFYH